MDIQNATAAGPSYGLLDVIFGNKPQEEEQADGQAFQPLMNLIQALKKKGEGAEESQVEAGRTDQETAPGKDVAEVRVVGIPEMFASLALMQQQQSAPAPKETLNLEKLAEAMQGVNAPRMQPVAQPSGQLDPQAVDSMLKEKSLAPLNDAEKKLLAEVNAKFAEAAAAEANPLPDADTQAAGSPEGSPMERLMQALASRGVDPANLKSVEENAPAAPEKFMNTETYLKMHETIGQQGKKPQIQEQGARMDLESDPRVALPQKAAVESLTERGGEQAKSDLFGKADKGDLEKVLKGGSKKGALEGTMPFASSLVQQLKEGPAPEAKDVFLQGAKPQEMRNELLGEVAGGIRMHAVRGGGEMKLVIHPEEMGEVKLKIAAARDGKIEVHVTTENKEVAELIRGGSKDLQASLGDQNLQLARFEVTVSDQSVSSLEQKGNLSDQLLGQNPQNGFQQSAGGDDSRFNRWDGSQGDQRQQGPSFLADEQDNRGQRGATRPQAFRQYPARDSSRRLDVVA